MCHHTNPTIHTQYSTYIPGVVASTSSVNPDDGSVTVAASRGLQRGGATRQEGGECRKGREGGCECIVHTYVYRGQQTFRFHIYSWMLQERRKAFYSTQTRLLFSYVDVAAWLRVMYLA